MENDVFCGAGRGQRLGEAKLAQGLSSLSLPGLLRYLDQPTLSIQYTCSISFREKLHSALHTLDDIHP